MPRASAAFVRPACAWPTVAVFVLAIAILAVSSWCAWRGLVPWGVAAGFNVLALYLAFTPAHEAAHKSVCQQAPLNTLVGALALLLWAPLGTFPVYRWLHLQHHRCTNEAGDPDLWAGGGRGWTLPLRWLVIDLHQLVFFLRHGGRQARRQGPWLLAQWLLIAAVLVASHRLGLLAAVVGLWLLPSRIALVLLTVVFDFLPHHPHTTGQSRDPLRATSVRVGAEWLLTPVFMGHNHHLIHHLHPQLPFYRLAATWRAQRAALLARHALQVGAFSLRERPR